MNRIVYKLILDLKDDISPVSVNCFQGEADSRILEIAFRSGGREYLISENTTAVFRAKTPADVTVYNNCRVENNRVIADITGSVLSTLGQVLCQIMLKNESGAVLYSPEFSIYSNAPVLTDEEIEGTKEYSELEKTLEEVKALKASLEKKRGLINNGTTTESLTDIVITTDNDGNALSLTDDFTIYLDSPSSSAAGNVVLYFNSAPGAFIANGITKAGAKSRCSMHFNGRTWENYSVTSSAFTSNAAVSSIVKYEVDDVIDEIKLSFSGGFPVGTKYYVYGRVL